MSTRSRSSTSLGRAPVPRPCTETVGLPLPELLETTPAALAQLACILATRVELWRPLLHVDPDRRWYARVAGGEGWEAWLHTWLPGQTTGPHRHGGSAGAFTVLSGELAEQVARPDLGLGRATTFRSPDVRAFDGRHRHQLTGSGTGPAASLHVYAPALR
jgi:hypothetical protein